MQSGLSNKNESTSGQDEFINSLSLLYDLILIINNKGILKYIKFPENNFIDINTKQLLNKYYKDTSISEKLNKIIDKLLTNKNKLNQAFEFSINNKQEEFFFNAKFIKHKKENSLTYILLAREITQNKLKELELKDKLEEKELKIKELEKEVDFYIKQGDVITNQRAKIQKERDKLAIEKTDIAKQKEIMETDLNFIMKQGDKIAEQKHKIHKQHKLVQQQKKKIEDSILYAKRIQSAILPPNRFIQHLLTEHFIFYKPRDIVSGDFYWIKQVDDKIFIAAADCTGHGVPGALMSMLGITFLNEIVNKNPAIHANEILDELRIHIISSLRQTGSTGESRDGLDIALCVINHKNKIMEYAGANNPLYLVRNNELKEIKADRMPIGIHRRSKEPFQKHKIKLEENDLIYIFSDGYIDQFGGENGRKFLSVNFKKILLEHHLKPLNEQKQIFEKIFEAWKGERKQLDDILVIGFKIAFNKEVINSKLDYNWSGKTILIAEDNEPNFFLLKKSLEKTNVNIIHAINGKEAIKLYKLNPDIDVVLMDIRMPLMDGIEATTLLKQMNKDLPIIVQTAFTMSTEKEKSFKAGCDDYISKPINIKELYATICKYIEK